MKPFGKKERIARRKWRKEAQEFTDEWNRVRSQRRKRKQPPHEFTVAGKTYISKRREL